MPVHILKPALRVQDLYEFQKRQKQWHTTYRGAPAFPVWTSRKPSRVDEMLASGSVYWIIKKMVLCRQAIIGLEQIQEEDEKPSYLIFCETDLVRTQALERKPFQGWRYLEASSAPKDIGPLGGADDDVPAELEQDLRAAGLL